MEQEDVADIIRSRWEIWTLVGVVGIFRATTLSNAFGVDEAHYARSGLMLYSENPYFNPTHLPATTGKLFIGFSQIVGTPGEIWARLPGFIFTLGSLYLTYEFGRILRGRLVGIFAASLTATFPLFMNRAASALLDGPLAFFLVLSVLSMYQYLGGSNRYRLVYITVFVVVGLLVKIQAFIYILPPVAFFVFVLYRKGELHALSSSAKQLMTTSTVVVLVSYWPFFLHIPRHIPYNQIPSIVPGIDFILGTPILRNFAYVFGAAFYVNILDVSSGQSTEVAGTMYQYPPIWSYEYWLFEHGGILWLVLLLIGILWGLNQLRASINSRDGLLLISVLPPLLLLGTLSVQYPRYLVPLLPLIAISGVAGADSLTVTAMEKVEQPFSKTTPILVLTIGMLVVVTLASNPGAIALTPAEGEFDSSFDQQAEYLVGVAEEKPHRPTVLLRQPTPVEYYLDGGRPPWRCSQSVAAGGQSTKCPVNTLRPFDYSESELVRLLETGQIDLAIVKSHQHSTNREWVRYLRSEGDRVHTFDQPETNSWVVYDVSS